MNFWRHINILSLDVALGATVGCAFFARIFGVSLLPHAYVSLGLIVWIIYTVDHLVDARNSNGEPSTERHRFHKRHSRPLLVGVILTGIAVALEAFFVRKPVLYAGLVLAGLVIGYLLLQASLKWMKELAGAFLYTAGVLAGPWSLLERSMTKSELAIILLFGATTYINLLLCSWFDKGTDERDGHASFATTFGELVTRRVISLGFLFIAVFGAVILLMKPEYAIYAVILLAMNSLLLLTFRFRDFFGVNDTYRMVGDIIFLIPGIYLLLSAWH